MSELKNNIMFDNFIKNLFEIILNQLGKTISQIIANDEEITKLTNENTLIYEKDDYIKQILKDLSKVISE